MVSFEVHPDDVKVIDLIWQRIQPIYEKLGINAERIDFDMDMRACHANGCPIDFQRLLEADEFTFNHDIAGIRNNINRETGQIENCFVPRCAA